MPGFFDDYPEFLKTSKTTPSQSRLNFRYHLIIESNVELLKDKRVVEIASHDGRWAFAAMRGGGAASVVGVEPRQHLVDNANKTFEAYGVPESTYRFICGDGFVEAERMGREGERYDTAMVLGFLVREPRRSMGPATIKSAGGEAVSHRFEEWSERFSMTDQHLLVTPPRGRRPGPPRGSWPIPRPTPAPWSARQEPRRPSPGGR